uniref:Alpha-mannosidase n=1 Tax=Timema tahoe TaxID=61484 RepID=A0A7R9NW33_9NEOP|nr:unnamed protein product [Timema tahoe]
MIGSQSRDRVLLALLLVLSLEGRLVAPFPNTAPETCGYQSCHKTSPGMLNVHIIPHSHDDVGWLKTVSQYYYGGGTSLITPDQDSNIDLLVIGSLLYCKISTSDHAATEVGTAFIHGDGETTSRIKEYNKEEETHLQYANVSAILDTTFQELKKNPDRSRPLVSFLRTCTGRTTHPLYCLDRSTVHVFEAVRDECTSIHSAKENSASIGSRDGHYPSNLHAPMGSPCFSHWTRPGSSGGYLTRAICLTLSLSTITIPPTATLTLPGLPHVPPRLTLPEHSSVPPRLTLPEHPSVHRDSRCRNILPFHRDSRCRNILPFHRYSRCRNILPSTATHVAGTSFRSTVTHVAGTSFRSTATHVVCWGKKELLAKSPRSQLCLKVVCWGKKELLAKSPRSQLCLKVVCWGPSADLFSGLLYNDYGPPSGFCWDLRCYDAEISSQNANDKVRAFLNFVNTQSKFYNTDNVLVTMGSDFTYMNATLYYTNLDRLIDLVNAEQTNGSNVHLIYSTPSCYLKAVHDSNPALTTKTDDFFPYANEAHAYWTGYYTSRPTLKRFERVGNNFLQVCKQLSAMTGVADKDSSKLDALREAMGIVQHHDAITGTEKLAVAKDYAKSLSSAVQACGDLSQQAINKLLIADQNAPTVEFKSCPLLNISRCEPSEIEDDFLATVYNPLARPVSHYVRIPVTGEQYVVTDPSGTSLVVQLVPVPEPVHSLEKSSVLVKTELIFHAVDLPPLGFRSYRVSRTTPTSRPGTSLQSSDTTIGNQNVTVEINETTGLLKKITVDGVEIQVEQNFHFYRAYSGSNGASNRRSDGAYVFRPQVDEATPIANSANYTTYKGDLVEEIHQVFSDWTSQVIRVYKEESHVEFEWLINTIPLTSGTGIEPVSRFVTDLSSDRLFYTDSNGRELLERRRDYRPSWNLTVTEPVSGNYYPVTSRILIRDPNQGLEFAVLNDRAQGGSSVKDGQIELMVHRRLKVDDGFGVAEVLDDMEPARGHHYVVAGRVDGDNGTSLAARERGLAQRKLLSPWLFFTPASQWSPAPWCSGLKSSLGLPSNVHLLTLEPWKDQAVLLRLEHFLEKNEDPILSSDADVNIKNYSSLKQELLAPLTVLSVNETTLDGSQWLSEVDRLQWNVTGTEERTPISHRINNFTITLSPMQIRTFIVGYY